MSLALSRALNERLELRAQAAHWRTVALTHWADAVNEASGRSRGTNDPDVAHLTAQLEAMQQTVSWRVTRPLRGVRRVIDRARDR